MENAQKIIEEAQKNNWVKIEAIEKIAVALGGLNVGEAIEECSIADLPFELIKEENNLKNDVELNEFINKKINYELN